MDRRTWLVYADWLDEQGSPQGQLIRLLWDLARDSWPERRTRRPDLWVRQQELWGEHGQWLSANLLGVDEEALDGVYLEFCPEFNLPVWPVQAEYASLEAAIAAGKYDYVDSAITAEKFGIAEGAIVVEDYFFVLGFAHRIQSQAAIERFDQINLQAATLDGLVVFGSIYPNVQHQWPIVGGGSSWVGPVGGRDVLFLGRWSVERRLGLVFFDGEWGRHCRFAAVRKRVL